MRDVPTFDACVVGVQINLKIGGTILICRQLRLQVCDFAATPTGTSRRDDASDVSMAADVAVVLLDAAPRAHAPVHGRLDEYHFVCRIASRFECVCQAVFFGV